MNKNNYIKQLKRLIKKYHPDLCSNSYLESKYNEITKTLVNKLNEVKAKIKLLKKLYKSYENTSLGENKIINSEKFVNEMGLRIL